MIAEEHQNIDVIKPVLSQNEGKAISCIINCMRLAITPFLQAYNLSESHSLNEDDLTQIFYTQVQTLLRDLNYPFHIGNQERDLTKQSKGIPDLFFYAHKLGKPPFSIFSIECKRLPAPNKRREREYVVGNKNNGGIERFKMEKHGKGLNECGMIGFVQKETFLFWQQSVNAWISALSTRMPDFWQTDEILAVIESKKDFAFLQSIAHRISSKDIRFHHLWINTQ